MGRAQRVRSRLEGILLGRGRLLLALALGAALEITLTVGFFAHEDPGHYRGVSSALGVLVALVAGFLGGPAVGGLVGLLGSLLFYGIVADRETGSILAVPVWVGAATVAGFFATWVRRADATIRESEARFREMADSAPVLIRLSGTDTLCNYVNEQWLRFTGRTFQQELGNGWAEGVHPDDHARCLRTYLTAFDRRQAFELEYRLRRADGEYRWVLDRGVPLFRASRFAGYIGSCVDVHDQTALAEQLREASESYRALIEASPLAVMRIDREGIVRLWSGAAERLFGWTADEVVGKQLPHIPDDRREEYNRIRERQLRGEILDGVDVERERKDGTPVHISIFSAPLRNPEGEVEASLSLVADISEQKRQDERERFLAEATEALASSLDYRTTFETVARLAVDHVGDWCSVDLVDEHTGRPVTIALWHRDPEKLALLHELERKHPRLEIPGHPIADVLATGEPKLMPEIPDELLEQASGDEDHLRLIRSLGFRSAILVPMAVGGRPLGVVTIVSAESGRRYGREDLLVGNELARRASHAVERARLHEAEREARRAAEEDRRRFGDVVDSLSAVVWEADPRTFRHTYVSARVVDVLGYPVERWLEEPGFWRELIHPDDREATIALAAKAVDEKREHELEYRACASDGRVVWLHDIVRVQLDDEGEPRVLRGVTVDVTERRKTMERERFLTEATEALASSLEYRRTLDTVTTLAVKELADWCSVDLLEGEDAIPVTIAVAHRDPAKVAFARELEECYPRDPERMRASLRVLETGEPLLLETIPDELLQEAAQDEAHLKIIRELGLRSAMVVRLAAGDVPVGTLAFISAESDRRYDRDDLLTAQELALRAGHAIERARLHEAERQARQQAERLQVLTAALSESPTVEEIAHVLVREGVAALGAQGGVVLIRPEGADELELVAQRGFPGEFEQRIRRIPLSAALGAAEAARTKRALWYSSADEYATRHPDLAESYHDLGFEAIVFLPLVSAGTTLGVLALSFATARTFGENERTHLIALAALCAQAIERARLYESEQAASDRLRRLQSIVDVGLSSLRLEELLAELLKRVRTALAVDRAAVLLLDEERRLLTVEAALGLEGVEGFTLPLGEGVAGQIAVDGRSVVVDDLAAAADVSPRLQGRAGSFAAVPLSIGGRIVGVLQVGANAPSRFAEEDVRLLELVAERAAIAIERASTYEREHEVAQTLQLAMLPASLPQPERGQIVARYRPGSRGLEIGGDWYDAIELPDGRIALSVGDVVGRGVSAAAAMGQLRNSVRALSLEGLSPGEIVERLNRLVELLAGGQFATFVYAVFDPARELVCFASAGHPPPLLLGNDGSTTYLEGGRSTPLGAFPEASYPEETFELEPGSTLILYTDGLVERRDRSLDEGLALLEEAAAAGPADLDELLDGLLATLVPGEIGDDIALLGMRLLPMPSRRLQLRLANDPDALASLRQDLRTWLEEAGAGPAEIYDITLAASEACSNAIEHPRSPSEEAIEVTAEALEGGVSIRVRDFGRWRAPRPSTDRGLGFRLMDALMDDVAVQRTPAGTEVRMSRRLRERALA